MSDTETPKMFSLTIKGEGINIEREVNQYAALQIMNIVMGGIGAPMPVHASPIPIEGTTKSADGVRLSLREYLDKIGATKKPDQITTIAHYVVEHEGQEDFEREDIRSRFLTAREPLPGNFGRDFAAALKNGWLAEVHGKKNRFYVTAKGVHAINNNFTSGKGAAARR